MPSAEPSFAHPSLNRRCNTRNASKRSIGKKRKRSIEDTCTCAASGGLQGERGHCPIPQRRPEIRRPWPHLVFARVGRSRSHFLRFGTADFVC